MKSSKSVSVILPLTLLIALLSACSKDDKASSNSLGEVVEDSESGIRTTVSNSTGKNSANIAIPKDATFETIEWTDLMPEADLKALENPPDYISEIEDGSEEDVVASQLKGSAPADADPYQQALVSKEIRPEYDGRLVRIPGFIVPLEFDDQETITTFFLVPFFGACLHMPPPPPNQIIYAEFEPGLRLEALYDPFWIKGRIATTLVENDMALAAYSILVAGVEPYDEYTLSEAMEAEAEMQEYGVDDPNQEDEELEPDTEFEDEYDFDGVDPDAVAEELPDEEEADQPATE